MNIVSYGGGTNSTAMLIECVNRGIRIDLILFADTGGERPHTYEYRKMFSRWLVNNDYPEIIGVQTQNRKGEYITLEQRCLEQNMLPSLAYGYKSCSEKHKIRPQNKFVNNWDAAKQEWKAGRRITKFIGYDADEHHRTEKDYSDEKYIFRYPLVEWDMGREECIETIKNAGLCLPGKSACFFCPATKRQEILDLNRYYPKLMDRALKMESNAQVTAVKGLGRSFAWADVLKQQDMFEDMFDLPPELACGCYDG